MILTLTEAAELGFTVESIQGSFRGVAADATASGRDPVDSTKYNLVFPDGVPIAISDDEKPVLTFKGVYGDGTKAELVADTSSLVFSGPTLTINDQTAGLECSFAGGCQITLTAEGLTSALTNPDNKIEVCGEICELDTDDSDSGMAICTVPALVTERSVEQFKLAEEKVLKVEWTDESDEKVAAYDDGVLTIDFDSSAGNDPCEVTG